MNQVQWLVLMTLIQAAMAVPGYAQTGIQPGDLSILFDRSETVERQQRLLNLKDLNFSAADFAAVLAHSRRDFIIKKELERDPRGYTSARETNAAAKSLFQNPCFLNMENWKVSAIRVAPFEYSLPGSAKNLDAFAEANKIQNLDRAIELRFTLTPVCKDDVGLDAGIHLIYNLWPDDPALRSELLQSREEFLRKNSQLALRRHIKAIASKAYQDFHRGVILKLAAVANARGHTGAASKVLNALYALTKPLFSLSMINEHGDVVDTPKEAERVSPPLRWVGSSANFSGENYFAALKSFVTEHAQRSNLTRVAMNFLQGGDSWTLSGLLAEPGTAKGLFAPADDSKAQAVFASLVPQELNTKQAVMNKNNQLQIKTISNSGYYGSLQIPNLFDNKEADGGVQVLDKKLFAEVDFYQNDGELQPKPRRGDMLPLSRLLNDAARVNAHSTSCTTCHTLAVINTYGNGSASSENIESVFQLEPQQNVRMMGFGRFDGSPVLRSLTIQQVNGDMKKLKEYLKAPCKSALK
jgi:hypothetical protein